MAFQNIFTDIVSAVITLIYNSTARYFKAYDGRAGGPGEASQQRRMGGERGEGRQLLKPGLGQPDGERKALSEMSVQKNQDAEKAKKGIAQSIQIDNAMIFFSSRRFLLFLNDSSS